MTDSPSSILLLRLQSTGSNTNLWGGYINTALSTLEQAAKGYQSQALTVDVTISWTNYATGNVGQAAVLKLTGTLAAAITMTLPAYQNELVIWNNSGAAVTIKCSGGTGVAVPNSRKTNLFCDGVDYYSSTPTWTGDTTTLTNNGDLVSYTQMSTAIAASVPAGTAGTFFNSAADTTRSYLASKLAVSGDITMATTNPAANETTTLTVDVKKKALAMAMALGV